MNNSGRPWATLFSWSLLLFSLVSAPGARAEEDLRRFGVVPDPGYHLMDVRLTTDEGSRLPEPNLQLLRRPASLDSQKNFPQRRQVQRMAEEIGLPSGSPW